MLPCDGDTLRLVYPSWVIVRDHLRHFHSLLWDPLRNMGQPLLASPPAEVLYPLQWISPFIGFISYSKIFIAAHTALVLFYGYKLFSMLHDDEWTGWLGAIALAFNGLMLNKASVHCDLAAMSWIPACFYYLCRRRALPLGVCLAFQWLAGLPTYSILTGVMMGVYALSTETRALYFRVLFQSGMIGAGLSAIQWVPFLECLHESQRGLLLANDVATQFSLSPIELLRGLVLPSVIASSLPTLSASDPAVTGFFIGPFLLALFIRGAWRSSKTTRATAGFALLAFVLTLGDHLKFYDRIPFITVFRFPALLAGSRYIRDHLGQLRLFPFHPLGPHPKIGIARRRCRFVGVFVNTIGGIRRRNFYHHNETAPARIAAYSRGNAVVSHVEHHKHRASMAIPQSQRLVRFQRRCSCRPSASHMACRRSRVVPN